MVGMSYLSGERIFGCSTCKTHLATINSLLSRAFNGQHGRGYLFDAVVNVVEGEPRDSPMTTGNHIIRDIYCRNCGTTLGWKYEKAYELSQKYKEGKYILERNFLVDVHWRYYTLNFFTIMPEALIQSAVMIQGAGSIVFGTLTLM